MSGKPGQAGYHIGPRQRREYAQHIRALLEVDADVTVADLARLTGASQNLATQVRQRWRAEKARGAA